MPYELIIFDADETLFDFKKSQAVALEESVKAHKIEYPYDKLKLVYEEINHKIWIEFEKGLIKVSDLKVDRFRRLFKALDLNLDPVVFAGTYMEKLSEASFIYEGVVDLLERLKDRYKLAIITNGLSLVQNKRIGQSDIHHYFEEIVISEDVNLVKPDPEIFDYTLEKMGHTSKDSVLMVGDNLKSDILGGIKAGIDTCWLNPRKKNRDADIEPTFELESVLEIEDIL
ncbi:YjjG family noncanonical pyrimidine nucleotidase [Fusibacter sp. JL216-2]|uniref:YjjG family noncanonical pyrimidine nucleotidase n=1 Tax=Fusibacter sp. JL216-2 TaxID=3071453 RepID=UPI003D335AED